MSHLKNELTQLKEDLLDMIQLVISQLKKSKEAAINFDMDLAREVIENDKRVNGTELKIDKDCENILALYTPVAIDLRFVLATLKINTNLERIGDYAEGIARNILECGNKIDAVTMDEFKVITMYDHALSMMEDALESFDNEDTVLARKVFPKDDFLNENNSRSTEAAIKSIASNPGNTKQILAILSMIRKLERVGDHIKNIAEEIIFYIEAKVLKHKKQKIKRN